MISNRGAYPGLDREREEMKAYVKEIGFVRNNSSIVAFDAISDFLKSRLFSPDGRGQSRRQLTGWARGSVHSLFFEVDTLIQKDPGEDNFHPEREIATKHLLNSV